ncbi:hypothetical protein [Neorhodopirellula pilleata]|uniref:Secreted protein n=1 Tax=Neorhodopirellula pilleata TaxID=2714738 RepID=A0A5C6AXD9_9BACT|nr:hypothetical protein [Neorhodopirellula pilleata]TWU03712.1 hypothetical protein Pla100_06420 [Neorhodopirellula pilleata]
MWSVRNVLLVCGLVMFSLLHTGCGGSTELTVTEPPVEPSSGIPEGVDPAQYEKEMKEAGL